MINKLIGATVDDHWRLGDLQQLRASISMVVGLSALLAIVRGLTSHTHHPEYWPTVALMLAVWLIMFAQRHRPFSLLWLPFLSVAGMGLTILGLTVERSLVPYGLLLYVHTIFSGLFFRNPFRSLMQGLAVTTILVGGYLLEGVASFDMTLVIAAVSAITAVFLSRALQNSRQQLREIRHLRLINSTVQELSGPLDSPAMQRLCQRSREAFRAQESVLLELSADGALLLPRAVSTTPEFREFALVSPTPRPVGQGSVGWVARHGKPILSGDVFHDPRFVYPPDLPRRDLSAMVVPVLYPSGRLAGVFRIQKEGYNQFNQEDFTLCQMWASEVGKVLEKAWLQNQLQQMATTDSLTGTYNRHYLNRRWPEITRQSQENEEPVTFLMLDCFNFKMINDRHGHMMGDQILQALGETLGDQVPPHGFTVRYGGDEFLVVLPGATYAQGVELKREIQQALERFQVRRPSWPVVIVDIGVYTGVGEELNTLLSGVDIALYDAKEDDYRQRLASLLESSVGERSRHMVQAVMTLTRIQELNDPYTRGHTERAKEMAMRIAREMGQPEDEVQVIGFGAVLHDVGKVVVPPHILNKPGPLNEEEWAIMRMHPQFGTNIIEELDLLKDVRPIILHHHERYDGATTGRHPGYPAGLKGEAIPIGARIVAVVDAFDAITSDRVYRKGKPVAEAMAELRRMAGTQFDPKVVAALERLIEQGFLAEN
ncbi:MAG: HD domain-containing phosphohydrolase [Bacillota bacterium]